MTYINKYMTTLYFFYNIKYNDVVMYLSTKEGMM